MKETVAVYIDYDNVSISLKEYYGKQSVEVLKKIREEIADNDNLRVMKAFCDFKHIEDEEILHLDSSLVELRHVSSSSANGKTNASDIALAIDVTKSLFNKIPIDNYYIVSSDSDMFPILKELVFFNKKVHLIYLEANIGESYMNAIREVGIDCKSIESMLGIPKYISVSEQLENNNEDLIKESLLLINDIINELAERYKKNGELGTTGKKNILAALEAKYPVADGKLILDYLIKNNYLTQFNNTNDHKCFCVSEDLGYEVINSEQVTVLTLDSFKKNVDK